MLSYFDTKQENEIFCYNNKMKILSKNLIIKFESEVNLEFIEKAFIENRLDPIRWAIVDINFNMGQLNIAYAVLVWASGNLWYTYEKYLEKKCLK